MRDWVKLQISEDTLAVRIPAYYFLTVEVVKHHTTHSENILAHVPVGFVCPSIHHRFIIWVQASMHHSLTTAHQRKRAAPITSSPNVEVRKSANRVPGFSCAGPG